MAIIESNDGMVNEQVFFKQFQEVLNEDMKKAAEPILQSALAEIEKRMRKELASNIVKFIEGNYSVMKRQHEIVITVNTEANKLFK